MELINKNQQLSTSSNFNIEEILDKDRNLTLEFVDDNEFLEIFFRLEIEKNNGEHLSPHTLKAYRSDAKTFFQFLQLHSYRIKALAFPEIFQYNQFINQTYARRTAQRKLLFVKRLLQFGYKTSFFPKDFSVWIEKPVVPKGHYNLKKESDKKVDKRDETLRQMEQEVAHAIALSFREIVKKVKRNEPYLKFLQCRNLFLGYLLYSTGMRASEIVHLNFEHIKNKKGVYYLNVLGKGNKVRKIPMDGENTVDAFEDYQQVVRSYLKKYAPSVELDDCPLFFSPITLAQEKKTEPMSYYTLYKIVKQGVKKSADIFQRYNHDLELTKNEKKIARLLKHNVTNEVKEGKISPHWFRHTYVTMLLENDVPLAIVKDLVGHSDISTTNIYLEKIKEEKKHEHLSKLDLGF